MRNDSPTPAPHAPLNPNSAFVVHLTNSADSHAVSGRVEHVASGRALRFMSVVQLLDFMNEIIARTDGASVEPRRESGGHQGEEGLSSPENCRK